MSPLDIMDHEEIQRRIKILDDVKKFVEESEKKVLFILQSLGWTVQHIKDEVTKRTECPYDSSHLVGPSKLDEHIKTCKTSRKQYGSSDRQFPDNCNSNCSSTVVIDAELCKSIIKRASHNDPHFKIGISSISLDSRPVPMSYNEMVASFSQDERRAIYDYVVSQTSKPNTSKIFHKSEELHAESSSSKSYLEEMALLRDMKRRRMKYKVSTKAKSYTEIMREVIDNQMKSHCEWINSADESKYIYNSSDIKLTVEKSQYKKKDMTKNYDSKEKINKKHKSKHKHKKEKKSKY